MTRAEQLIDTLQRLGYSSAEYVVDQTDGSLTLTWRSGTGRTIDDLLSESTQAGLPPRVVAWSCREFLLRFTTEERHLVIKASRQSDAISDLQMMLLASPIIHSNAPDLLAGMAALVASKLLTQERANEILGHTQS